MKKLDGIIGQEIHHVFQEYEEVDGWLDSVFTYLKLRNGEILWFAPSDSAECCSERIPKGAKRASRPVRRKIEGKRIHAVFRQIDEGVPSDDHSLVFRLEDGTHLYEIHMAPGGTGAAGLYILSESDVGGSLGEDLEKVSTS